MANFTMTLYDLLAALSPEMDVSTLFPSTYELRDPTRKAELEGKIFSHFALREIGQETPGRFLTTFRTTFLEALPTANKLYEAYEHDFLPNLFKTEQRESTGEDATSHSYQTTGRNTADRTTAESSHADTNTTANSTNKMEETPYTGYPQGSDYTSSKTSGDNTGTSTSTGGTEGTDSTVGTVSGSGTDQNTRNTHDVVSGRTGTEAEAFQKYLAIIRNVDEVFYDALEPCFMQIF